MAEQRNVLEDISTISDIVSAARDLVADGQTINIQPLEKEVEDICARLAVADADAAREARPVLLCLIEELSHLAQTMDDCHQKLSGELRSQATHGNAASAYSPPPTGPKKSS